MASVHKNDKFTKLHEKPSMSEEKLVTETKNGIEITDFEQRKKVHNLLLELGNIMSTSEWSHLDNYLEPKAVLNRLNEEIIGRVSIQAFLSRKNIGALKYFFVRYFYDSEKMLLCSEWITRRKKGNDKYYHEKMVVWFLKLTKENTIKTWYIWRDPFYSRFIESLEEPIPDDCWMKSRNNTKSYTSSELCDFVRRKFSFIENADYKNWGKTLHPHVEIRPPWRVQVRKEDVMHGLLKFLNDFEDVTASLVEILYDYTHPNVAIYIQLFSATKKGTKEKCEDIDLSMIMLDEDQIRYWKCYFYEKEIPNNHFSFVHFIKDVLEESLKSRSIQESDK